MDIGVVYFVLSVIVVIAASMKCICVLYEQVCSTSVMYEARSGYDNNNALLVRSLTMSGCE